MNSAYVDVLDSSFRSAQVSESSGQETTKSEFPDLECFILLKGTCRGLCKACPQQQSVLCSEKADKKNQWRKFHEIH
jgi:hypothetical protein